MALIRQERPADFGPVAEVNRSAFGRNDEARLVDILRQRPGFVPELSLVAEIEGRVVGHILFTTVAVQGTAGSHPSLALAPMAVSPEFQGQGIGSELVRVGLQRARELGHTTIIVIGHAEYYPRFGFEPASRHRIQPPFPVPDEAFMVYALVPGAPDGIEGVVRYPEAFDTM
jgi:putative acetyltransferase